MTTKITFMGAGSTIFAKNILGDCMLSEALRESHFALYDIDRDRLQESMQMLDNLNGHINGGRARITAHLGEPSRREALEGADFVVNAIQVGGYEPATVTDFEIPKRFGLRQTIADTLGIGGIFRALRTIPVVLEFSKDMEGVCPDALFLNYVNPMCMVSAALQRAASIETVGLCHSVPGCAEGLLRAVGMERTEHLQWRIAGINHQAWLLEITDAGTDLYPEIKSRAAERLPAFRRKGAFAIKEELRKHHPDDYSRHPDYLFAGDMVRMELMLRFGYYVTESSEHNAEYYPWFIKNNHPKLIDEYGIPLDEYLRRCVDQIEGWGRCRDEMLENPCLEHTRSIEYGSRIMEAVITDQPYRFHGNVMNTGLIPNLPSLANVEVPCLADRNGIQPCFAGNIPEACAALNRTNINSQILTVEAALTGKREHIYQAALLDPHTGAELTIDETVSLCDALIEAHGPLLPAFR